MADKAANRPARKTHAGDAVGERGDEHSPLQARAAFIENWGWEFVVGFNQGACERGRAQHGNNSETHQRVEREWKKRRKKV
jgi:hypothetical protein